jgi:hypothetical protein
VHHAVARTCDCGTLEDVGCVDAAANADFQNDNIRPGLDEDLQACRKQATRADSDHSVKHKCVVSVDLAQRT